MKRLEFKSQPGMAFVPRFLLHLYLLATANITSTLTTRCKSQAQTAKGTAVHLPMYVGPENKVHNTHSHCCLLGQLLICSHLILYLHQRVYMIKVKSLKPMFMK